MTKQKAAWGETIRWLRDVALNWESDDCLFFPFALGTHGYGVTHENGEQLLAHRFICGEAHGPAPSADLDAAHSCNQKPCSNKRHLRWDTRAGNLADRLRHGTLLRGTSHPTAKLTEPEVLAIRDASGTQTVIAKEFGISQRHVSDIKARKRWAWL